MSGLLWAGGISAAIIAITTVAKWVFHHAYRVARWVMRMVRLPADVAQLATSVTELSASVSTLADAMVSTTPQAGGALARQGMVHPSSDADSPTLEMSLDDFVPS